MLTRENVRLKDRGDIYSPGGLRKDWTPEHLRFVEFLKEQGYRLRYSSGFVPDINQILIKNGGIFTCTALKITLQASCTCWPSCSPWPF